MSEIEVGEYVRTKNHGIKKIDHLTINPNVTVNKYRYYLGIDEDGDRCYGTLKTTDIVKHSKNIIDLIEVGDYVNGWKVLSVVPTFDKPNEIGLKLQGFDNLLYDIKIYSIVTKEQFNSVMYKVVE